MMDPTNEKSFPSGSESVSPAIGHSKSTEEADKGGIAHAADKKEEIAHACNVDPTKPSPAAAKGHKTPAKGKKVGVVEDKEKKKDGLELHGDAPDQGKKGGGVGDKGEKKDSVEGHRDSDGEDAELHTDEESEGTVEDEDEDDEEEGPEQLPELIEDRVRRLSLSYQDLMASMESGIEFEPYRQKKRSGRFRQAVVNLLPVRPKASKHILPISSSGCLNKLTYGWVTPIIIRIYRHGSEILNSYTLGTADSAQTHCARMERLWKEELEKHGPAKASFRRVVLRAFRTRLIVSLSFLLLFVCFSLLNPIFLIRGFLEYLSQGDMKLGAELGYVVGMILCELLRSLTMGQCWIINYHSGLRIRAGTMTLLFKKILRLKGLKNKSVGELVNLVGNDSQRIFDAMAVGPMVLAGPIAMMAGCVYAVFYLGPWALVGCAVFVGFYPFNAFISNLTTYLRRKGIFITDKRVRMTTELLTCIKLIKMYAWEKPFAQKIAKIRHKERHVLEQSAMVQSISTGTAIMVPTVASALTFIAIVSNDHNLTAAEAFSFVALLNSMRFALAVLPYSIKSLSEVTVALKRYTSIMLMKEMNDEWESVPPPGIAIEVKDANLNWDSVGTAAREIEDWKKDSAVVTQPPVLKAPSEEQQKMLKESHVNISVDDDKSSNSVILTDISFSLAKGQLLGVCGSVGSGKSSLIQALLGRMELMSGSIGVDGAIAYVPQQAWIMNASVRENIVFGSIFNQERYDKVVEACALKADFDAMVCGDTTEIGERGINLSGGQKQRISMARALYSNSDIFLLDDPLSAVDIQVGRHLFDRCISGYLKEKSVIFVTHQLQYLPQCDMVLFLKEGQVCEQGTHTQLMEHKGDYATLMSIYYNETVTDKASTDSASLPANHQRSSVHSKQSKIEAGMEKAAGRQSIIANTRDSRNRSVASSKEVIIERAMSVTSKSRSEDSMSVQERQGSMKKGRLIKEEEMHKGKVGLGVVAGYMKVSGGVCSTSLVLMVFLLSIACQNAAPVFLTYWLGKGSGNTTIELGNTTMISKSITDNPKLSIYVLVYGMIIVGVIVLLLLRAVSFMKYTLRASSKMHDEVFTKILRCPMSFFDTTPLGRIVNRFSADMDEVDVRLPMTMEVFLSNILHILFSLGLISYVAPWFLVALVPLAIIFFIIYRVFTGTIRDIKNLDMVSRAPLLTHVTASVQGIFTIHAYGKSREFERRFCKMLNKHMIPFTMFFISNRWLALRMDLMCAVVTGVASLVIILKHEDITPAMAGLALSSALQMTGLFQFTVRLATETQARFTSVQRVLDYSKIVQSEGPLTIPSNRPPKRWPSRGSLVFKNVQVRYLPHLPFILKDISFTVYPQEKIGIVGRTGSGKSTLGVALFRLVELSKGSIKIDDLDISQMGLEDLRSKLSIIPQEPVLFIGTIRYNLDPLNQHTDDELWLALEKCHIKEGIAALEQQLMAPVIENGENFSVGERQLLCMARALLRHSKVLFLDEATAAIDTETDALVQATLKEAFWDCTLLIIAHRLNTVLHCDRILVLGDGKVIEYDRPSTLTSKENSEFRKMLDASSSMFGL